MARASLPITLSAAESLFRESAFEFASARVFLSLSPRLRCEVPTGAVTFELVGDKQRPPHLRRADMTIQPGLEPADLASTLDPWYRLADAVSASTEIPVYYSTAQHEMIIGTGGEWWAWRFANPIKPPGYGLAEPWGFDHKHVPLDHNDPHGTQLVFSFRRWTGKPQYLRIETQTLDRLTGSLI